jgi:hypothetical protein
MVYTARRVPAQCHLFATHIRNRTVRRYPKSWCFEQTRWSIVEWKPVGKRGTARPRRKTDRVRWSTTKHGQPEDDTRDRNGCRNLVLGERRPLYSGQCLDERRNERMTFLGRGENGNRSSFSLLQYKFLRY